MIISSDPGTTSRRSAPPAAPAGGTPDRRSPSPAPARRRSGRAADARDWLAVRARSLAALTGLLIITGVVQATNMASAPARVDAEGTYVAQAWAVEHLGALAHYTYGYEHPPLGWLQLAAWTSLTRAFDRAPNAVAAGREAMLLITLVSVVLVWVLARRLELARWAAALAVALFGLSPLAVSFHRAVYLDNVATPWLLGAFVLALTPRRHLGAYAAAGACFGVAVLSKETSLVLLPALAWQLWQSSAGPTRRFAVAVAAATVALAGGFSVLFAATNGQLLPGADHVSLVDGIRYQLFERNSSGSIADAASLGHRTVTAWLALDPVTPFVAIAAATASLAGIPRLRPVALALATLLLCLLRPGYLPVPLVIAMMPFGAIVIAGAVHRAWEWAAQWPWAPVPPGLAAGPKALARIRRLAPVAGIALAGALLIGTAAPTWATQHRVLRHDDLDAPMRLAESWIVTNVPRDRRLIVDDTMWVDLVRAKYPAENVVWFAKVDTDPAVQARAPRGWRDYDVLVITEAVRSSPESLPEVIAALEHSEPLAVFGDGPGQVEIHHILSNKNAGETGQNSAVNRGQRARLGTELADNHSLMITDDARDALVDGSVDGRVTSVVAALAALGPVRVQAFPAFSGEDRAGDIRRVVDVSATDDEHAAILRRFFEGQTGEYRPVSAQQVPATAEAGSFVRVIYPVASLS